MRMMRRNPMFGRDKLPAHIVREAEEMERKLRAFETQALSAHATGDYARAEMFDQLYEEQAENLENFLDDIEFEVAEVGDDEVRAGGGWGFSSSPFPVSVSGPALAPGSWPPPAEEELAQLYSEYISDFDHPSGRFEGLQGKEREKQLAEVLLHVLHDYGTPHEWVTDDHLADAARDAYENRMRRRRRVEETKKRLLQEGR